MSRATCDGAATTKRMRANHSRKVSRCPERIPIEPLEYATKSWPTAQTKRTSSATQARAAMQAQRHVGVAERLTPKPSYALRLRFGRTNPTTVTSISVTRLAAVASLRGTLAPMVEWISAASIDPTTKTRMPRRARSAVIISNLANAPSDEMGISGPRRKGPGGGATSLSRDQGTISEQRRSPGRTIRPVRCTRIVCAVVMQDDSSDLLSARKPVRERRRRTRDLQVPDRARKRERLVALRTDAGERASHRLTFDRPLDRHRIFLAGRVRVGGSR